MNTNLLDGKIVLNELFQSKNFSTEPDGRAVKMPKEYNSTNLVNFMDFSNYENALKSAEIISKARCVPKEFWNNPSDILVVIQFGYELGLNPMVAIQNMMVVNNRPTIYGDAMLALCMRGKGQKFGFIDCIEAYEESKGEWTCTSIRDGREPIIRTFTMEEAKLGGLLNKPGSWQTNRKRMMQYRPRSFALRDTYPDILKGILSYEEVKYGYDDNLLENTSYKNNTAESMKERLKSKSETYLPTYEISNKGVNNEQIGETK